MSDKADNILMTSCPVVHSIDGIDRGFERKSIYNQLVVTVTDRLSIESQLPLLSVAKSLFPAQRRILALHQDFQNQSLWQFAAKHQFDVIRHADYESFLSLYRGTDMHFGNRVHAHLRCLSLSVPTFLTPFDLRQVFFSQSLDFPLISKMPAPEIATYDFNRFSVRQEAARKTMNRFVSAVRTCLELNGDQRADSSLQGKTNRRQGWAT